jgi:hypothetical protein
LGEAIGGHQTRLLSDRLAVFEYEKGGDAADAELGRRLALIGVHLEKHGSAGEAFGGLREVRRHHPARAAPRRPNVEHDEALGVGHVLSEALVIDIERGVSNQVRAALAALGRQRIAPRGDAIASAAYGAGDLGERSHVRQLSGLIFLMPSVSISSFS